MNHEPKHFVWNGDGIQWKGKVTFIKYNIIDDVTMISRAFADILFPWFLGSHSYTTATEGNSEISDQSTRAYLSFCIRIRNQRSGQ